MTPGGVMTSAAPAAAGVAGMPYFANSGALGTANGVVVASSATPGVAQAGAAQVHSAPASTPSAHAPGHIPAALSTLGTSAAGTGGSAQQANMYASTSENKVVYTQRTFSEYLIRWDAGFPDQWVNLESVKYSMQR